MLVINHITPIKNMALNTHKNCYIQRVLSTQNKRAIKPHHDMEETSMHVTNWRKPILKGHTLCDFNYTTFCKRQNDSGTKGTGGCQRVGAYIWKWLVKRPGCIYSLKSSPFHSQGWPPNSSSIFEMDVALGGGRRAPLFAQERHSSRRLHLPLLPVLAAEGLPVLTPHTENIARSAVYTVP